MANRADAEPFLMEFRERLVRFGLELHPDKTRLIEFGAVRRPRPKTVWRGIAGDLHLSWVHPLLWATHEQRSLQRLAHDGEEANGCEAPVDQG